MNNLEKWIGYKGILEASQVVAVFEFKVDGLEPFLKVKVVEFSNGDYMGAANLTVNGYASLTIQKSIEGALSDAVRGFLSSYSEKANVKEVEDW